MTTGTIDVTPGTGEQILFDKGVTGPGAAVGDLQIIKLGLGGDNAYEGYQSGRAVDGTTDEAAAWVEDRPDVDEFTTTLSIDTSLYAAGDLFGELQQITGASKAVGGGVRIDGITVVDKDSEAPEFDILFFNDSITAGTDNAVFAPSDADLIKFRAGVSILAADWSTFSTNSVAYLPNLGMVVPELVSADLYFVVVIRSGETFTAATDIFIQVAYTRL